MREFYNLLFSLPPQTFTLVSVLLGFLLIDDLTIDEQRALGGMFVMIGETIWVSSSQEQVLVDKQQQNELITMKRDIANLKNRTGLY